MRRFDGLRVAAGLEYDERGRGEAVLLVHGAIVADSFAPMLDADALAGYRRIRYRRRGYGSSLPLDGENTIETHAQDARSLLAALGVDRAHLVAHSGGGPIAVQLAVDAPELVASLVLLEPALQTAADASAFAELLTPLVELHRRGESAKAVHLWMRAVGGPGWRDEIEQRVPDGVSRAEADAAGTFDGDLPALARWDFDTARARITQPVLHIAGEASAANAERVASMLREAVPRCELAVIHDSNHVNLATRTRTAEAIAGFLDRHPIDASHSDRLFGC